MTMIDENDVMVDFVDVDPNINDEEEEEIEHIYVGTRERRGGR